MSILLSWLNSFYSFDYFCFSSELLFSYFSSKTSDLDWSNDKSIDKDNFEDIEKYFEKHYEKNYKDENYKNFNDLNKLIDN